MKKKAATKKKATTKKKTPAKSRRKVATKKVTKRAPRRRRGRVYHRDILVGEVEQEMSLDLGVPPEMKLMDYFNMKGRYSAAKLLGMLTKDSYGKR